MRKTISEGGQGATIRFKASKIQHNLKFYDAQNLSVCYLLFMLIVNSSSVLVCFPTSKCLFFYSCAVEKTV